MKDINTHIQESQRVTSKEAQAWVYHGETPDHNNEEKTFSEKKDVLYGKEVLDCTLTSQ